MCEALRTIMADDINNAKIEGLKEGKIEGLKEGKIEGLKEGKIEGQKEGALLTLISLVKDNILSVKEAAKRAGMAEALFKEKMTLYM